MEPVAAWRVHIGAHKTATKHLQDTLALQRPILEASGVDFIPRKKIRDLGLIKLVRRKTWRRLVPDNVYRRRWQEGLAAIRCGPQTVIISDENFAGGPNDLLGETMYPFIEKRILALASMLRPGNLHLFLSIRSFETLLPSAYAQSLRNRPVSGGFDAVRARWLAHPPSWAGLIDRIRSALPDAKLTVWKFEDYRFHDLEIISGFCGSRVVQDIPLPPPRHTMTPSATAVAAMEALSSIHDRAVYRSEVRKILFVDPGSDKFLPLADVESSTLANAYFSDLKRIKATDSVMLMDFN